MQNDYWVIYLIIILLLGGEIIMKCPKCGKEVHDGELFCGNCGYNLAQNNRPSVQTKAQVKKPNNTNKIIIAIVAIILVVSAVTGGALFVANKKPSYVFGTTKKEDLKILKDSAKDGDYPLYYSYDKYKTFWKSHTENKNSENSKKYNGLSTKKIDSEIADLDLSDYKRKSVDSDITTYTSNDEYFENIISVKPNEKNQKYKRNYYFIDGSLKYAYIYDPDNSDDWYKLYYDGSLLYCYKTPDKTYKYSDITPTKWGCFACVETYSLYYDYIYDSDDDDDDDDYDEYEDEDYILPTSDSEYLTRSDVEDLSQEENRLAINEIYARHGYTYQTEDLKEYFEDKSWYHSNPDINQSTWNDSMLNNYERENINLLTTVAKEKGYR